jgi:hypothetical protein
MTQKQANIEMIARATPEIFPLPLRSVFIISRPFPEKNFNPQHAASYLNLFIITPNPDSNVYSIRIYRKISTLPIGARFSSLLSILLINQSYSPLDSL